MRHSIFVDDFRYKSNHKPQLFALTLDIFHVFFCPQRERPYHIADKENSRRSHSRRMLHMSLIEKLKLPRLSIGGLKYFFVKKKYRKHVINRIPGAFSQMSHRGTSLGSASPTRTCRLASLLHICTCHTNYISQTYFIWLRLASTLWIGNLELVTKN